MPEPYTRMIEIHQTLCTSIFRSPTYTPIYTKGMESRLENRAFFIYFPQRMNFLLGIDLPSSRCGSSKKRNSNFDVFQIERYSSFSMSDRRKCENTKSSNKRLGFEKLPGYQPPYRRGRPQSTHPPRSGMSGPVKTGSGRNEKGKLRKICIRTPENSLRGIFIIRIKFSKFGPRFTIIRMKIADFRKNLTLLIRINPADFRRLV